MDYILLIPWMLPGTIIEQLNELNVKLIIDFRREELYEYMLLNHRAVFCKIFCTIEQNISNGGFIFNCSAGKDRSGIVAALLLGCFGIDEESIIADYLITKNTLDKKITI